MEQVSYFKYLGCNIHVGGPRYCTIITCKTIKRLLKHKMQIEARQKSSEMKAMLKFTHRNETDSREKYISKIRFLGLLGDESEELSSKQGYKGRPQVTIHQLITDTIK